MFLLEDVLAQKPLGLVFDIDGTLSPIAPTPGEARLYPGVAALLEQARQYAHVAIMTGRALENGAAMVNVDGITYIGSHGLEWSDGLPAIHVVKVVPEAQAYVAPIKALLDLAEQELGNLPGLIVERKRIGGAIHYRLSPAPEAARQTIISLLKGPAQHANIHLSEGKRVVELRAPMAVNKGRALRQFVEQMRLHGVIFAGDDRTDLDAIMEIAQLRHEGLAALSIAVQHTDTLPALLEQADIVVQKVPGMVEILQKIVTILSTRGKSEGAITQPASPAEKCAFALSPGRQGICLKAVKTTCRCTRGNSYKRRSSASPDYRHRR